MKTSPHRFLLSIAMLMLALLACVIDVGGGDEEADLQATETALALTEMANSEDEPTEETLPNIDDPTKAAADDPTPTLTQPAPPEETADGGAVVWALLQASSYYEQVMVSWDIDAYPLTYTFEPYANAPSMELRVNEPFLVLYPEGGEVRYDLTDVELQTFMAIPKPNVGLALICRQQTTAGENYSFLINQDAWWITKNVDGQAQILAEGVPSAEFAVGNWDVFRFRCEGDRLSAWDSSGLLAEVQDSTFANGAAGQFYINDPNAGPSIVRLFRDRAYARDSTREAGTVRDVVETGEVYIEFFATWQFHGPVATPDFDGMVMSLGLQFENRGESEITINAEDIFITWAEFENSALAQMPTELRMDDLYPITFPFTLPPGGYDGGKVFFTKITEMDLMEGWQLVVDLRDQGLGIARFDIPVQ